MIVLVTGGRKSKDRDKVFAELDGILAILPPRDYELTILQGGCPTGVDSFAREWCLENEVDCITAYARWKKQGSAGGPIRNTRMIKRYKPDAGLVFPGGSGTDDCEMKLIRANISYKRVK